MVQKKKSARRAATGKKRPEKQNAAEVMLYLSGLDYPRQRQGLLSHARSQRAPESILNYLERLPDKEYTSLADVEIELRKSG